MSNSEEMYITNLIGSCEINAPDGKYYVVEYSVQENLYDRVYDRLKKNKGDNINLYAESRTHFISDTTVEVRSGWFHIGNLIQATKEILLQNGYWEDF